MVVGLGSDLHGLLEGPERKEGRGELGQNKRREGEMRWGGRDDDSLSSSGENHELLESKRVSGVGSSVDDVEAGKGENVGGLDSGEISEVLVERDSLDFEKNDRRGRQTNESAMVVFRCPKY